MRLKLEITLYEVVNKHQVLFTVFFGVAVTLLYVTNDFKLVITSSETRFLVVLFLEGGP